MVYDILQDWRVERDKLKAEIERLKTTLGIVKPGCKGYHDVEEFYKDDEGEEVQGDNYGRQI